MSGPENHKVRQTGALVSLQGFLGRKTDSEITTKSCDSHKPDNQSGGRRSCLEGKSVWRGSGGGAGTVLQWCVCVWGGV